MPTVLVWKNEMLPASETFVRSQSDSLRTWTSTTAGLHRVTSTNSRAADLIALDTASRTRIRLGRFTGLDPSIVKLVRAAQPDIIHAHFIPSAWSVLRAAKKLGIPLIVTVHGVDITSGPSGNGLRPAAYRFRMRKVFKHASHIIAVSNYIRDRALEQGAPEHKTRVHYTGIPVPDQDPTVPKVWDLIFIGRLVEKKAPLDLIAAIARVRLLGLPVRAVFIGDGPLLSAARDLDRELKTEVTFLGAVAADEVRKHLLAARMAAVVSKTAPNGDMEGLPTVLMEIAAAGIPVVATRHSGNPEAVIDNRTGILVNEGDVRAIAASIERLLTDRELAARLGAAARENVLASFDIDKQAGDLESIYAQALSAAI